MMKEIGGYFNLELNEAQNKLHQEAYKFNTGRNSFEFILKSLAVKKVYLPIFTCDVVLEPLHKLSIPFEFYRVDTQLELSAFPNVNQGEYLLYTNYFGMKDAYITSLALRYRGQLIVDNAQSLFSAPIKDVPTFYSPRKFLGLPDGGYAYLAAPERSEDYELDYSYARCAHLLKRLELKGEQGYVDFKDNSKALSQQPMRSMSVLTRRLIDNVDVNRVKQIRKENFHYLHQAFAKQNRLLFDFSAMETPMVYPLWVDDTSLRQKLIDNGIFVATYWPNVFDWCSPDSVEYQLASNIIPLPIDQRYSFKEMDQIIEVVNDTTTL